MQIVFLLKVQHANFVNQPWMLHAAISTLVLIVTSSSFLHLLFGILLEWFSFLQFMYLFIYLIIYLHSTVTLRSYCHVPGHANHNMMSALFWAIRWRTSLRLLFRTSDFEQAAFKRIIWLFQAHLDSLPLSRSVTT